VLGEHVTQKGSLVDATRRVSTSRMAPREQAQILEIEKRVNAEILANVARRRV
jgi:alanyl-tRNA synthetase